MEFVGLKREREMSPRRMVEESAVWQQESSRRHGGHVQSVQQCRDVYKIESLESLDSCMCACQGQHYGFDRNFWTI